jgi:germination protein M
VTRRIFVLAALPIILAACGGGGHTSSSTTPTAAIVIGSPSAGEAVRSPIHVSGTANTFEARFVLELKAHGRVLVREDVMASSGTGKRGTYSVSIPFSVTGETPAELVAFELSAKNGQPSNSVSQPIRLLP